MSDPLSDRDRLLAQIRERVATAGEHPGAVLSDDAVADADALLAASAEVESDLDALQIVGWMYWVRHDLRNPPSPDDLKLASMYLHPCWQADPASVPPETAAALAAAEPGDFVLWSYLGSTTLQRAMQQRDVSALNTGIRLLRLAESQMKADYVSAAETFANLGSALNTRYHYLNLRPDLDDAVAAMEQAVAVARPDNPRLPQMRHTLAVMRDEQTAAPPPASDRLDADIAGKRNELAQAAADDPDRPVIESDLGKLLASRYHLTDATEDLDEAVDHGTRALAAVARGDDRRMAVVSGLVAERAMRYERLGHLEDLDDPIQMARTEIDADPTPSPARTALISDLSVALRLRFERFGEADDIDEAVSLQREVVTQLGSDPRHLESLSNLCNTLAERYDLTHDPADPEGAVSAGKASVGGIPAGHPSRSGCLSNLGRAYLARWDAGHDLADLDRAVATLREAVGDPVGGAAGRPGPLGNLALALSLKADHQGNDTAVRVEAVALHESALAQTGPDDPERAQRCCNLGRALQRQWEQTGDEAAALRALSLFEEASHAVLAATSVRASAAAWAGDMAAAMGRWATATDDFAVAIGLLPQVASAALVRTDAQRWLANFAGVASTAAACAVAAGDPDRALALFEAGRGVLLSRALDADEDLALLSATEPELARRFDQLRREMDGVAAPTENRVGLAERRRRAAQDFDRLVGQVRARPGLATFLAAPDSAGLVTASDAGSVIVVNASHWGSQVLLLRNRAIEVVPLPDLRYDDASDRASSFLAAIEAAQTPGSSLGEQIQAQAEIRDTLGWLWDCVGRPVVTALQPPETTGDGALTRVWWVPSGPMTVFPLGVAGRFETPGQSVPDQLVSSYAPTVRSLLSVRARAAASPGAGPSTGTVRLLGVSMPHTEGQADLPGTERESEVLRRLFPGCQVLEGEHATLDAVTSGLRSANWAHFACHGLSDRAQPQQSMLLLQDYQTHPLTVVELSRLQLQEAEFAFLSACSTGATTPGLADEAVHITGGCLLAGFRSVIGTFWTIDDDVAVEIAEHVYDTVRKGGIGSAARALHDSLASVRRRYPRAPSLWAAHVHVGT